jgi:hypothetical protein
MPRLAFALAGAFFCHRGETVQPKKSSLPFSSILRILVDACVTAAFIYVSFQLALLLWICERFEAGEDGHGRRDAP